MLELRSLLRVHLALAIGGINLGEARPALGFAIGGTLRADTIVCRLAAAPRHSGDVGLCDRTVPPTIRAAMILGDRRCSVTTVPIEPLLEDVARGERRLFRAGIRIDPVFFQNRGPRGWDDLVDRAGAQSSHRKVMQSCPTARRCSARRCRVPLEHRARSRTRSWARGGRSAYG